MRTLLLATSLWLCSITSQAQSTDSTLEVVCWNIEWFGSANNGPSQKDQQEANTVKILKWLNADLYGLVEIVDTMRFRRVVDSMGREEYGYVISPYCTQATQPSGNAWLTGQKLAFIYRKSIFSNVTTRGLMRNSATANTNWASGRFPFMLSAKVTIKGVSKDMQFIVIHGKAGSTETDHNRRIGGAMELKDTLDRYYPTASTFLIGDFNDALNGPIYAGASTSSYLSFVMDSTDADHYKSITLPLGVAGQTTMINFPNVIDNHVISNEVAPFYIPGSARVVTDVTAVVADYVTARQTSDHYPVLSRYNLNGNVVTSVPFISPSSAGIHLWPNPANQQASLRFDKAQRSLQLNLFDGTGQQVWNAAFSMVQSGQSIQLPVTGLSGGVYYLSIQTPAYRSYVRLIVP
jgi:trimeric autotransporter adhesin